MTRLRWTLAILLLLPVLAPAPGWAQGGDASRVGERKEEKKIRRVPDLITAEEIATVPEVEAT